LLINLWGTFAAAPLLTVGRRGKVAPNSVLAEKNPGKGGS
jgi:hypothetical protein